MAEIGRKIAVKKPAMENFGSGHRWRLASSRIRRIQVPAFSMKPIRRFGAKLWAAN